jgi:hypothetical protein
VSLLVVGPRGIGGRSLAAVDRPKMLRRTTVGLPVVGRRGIGGRSLAAADWPKELWRMAVGLPMADRRGIGGRSIGDRWLAEGALEDGCGLARG